MKKSIFRGLQKMSKYLGDNYYSGSILERASYKKNKVKPYKVYGSLIERKISKKDDATLWQKLRKIVQK